MRIMQTVGTTPTLKFWNPCHFVYKRGLVQPLRPWETGALQPGFHNPLKSLVKKQPQETQQLSLKCYGLNRDNIALQGAFWKFVSTVHTHTYTHKIVGLESPKSSGQASRLETQGKTAVSSPKAEFFFPQGTSVFSLKAFN